MNNKMIMDAYYGTGGFLDGSYLIKHPRETDAKYERRKSLAYYINHVAVAVNSQVDPIFKDEIKRDWGNSVTFDQFREDTDRGGTDIQELVKRTALKAKLLGYTFLLVDNTIEQGRNMQEVREYRTIPYVIEIDPDKVTLCEFDEFGRLARFSYNEESIDEEGKKITIECEWTKTRWRRKRDEQEESGDHNLGRVPVVIWYSRVLGDKELPPSEFISIVQCNFSIYQKCSWLDEILANQAFPILTYPGVIEKNVTVGTENALTFPEDSGHRPDFIAPPSTPADMLQAQINQLVTEIYRMAHLSNVTGVREAMSGVAKAWDFQRANQALAEYSYMCQRAELDLIDVYERWTGETLNYTCEYPREFSIADISDELDNAQRLFDLHFNSRSLTVEVAKRIMSVYLPNIEEEIYDDIIKEIEETANEERRDYTYTDLIRNINERRIGAGITNAE